MDIAGAEEVGAATVARVVGATVAGVVEVLVGTAIGVVGVKEVVGAATDVGVDEVDAIAWALMDAELLEMGTEEDTAAAGGV